MPAFDYWDIDEILSEELEVTVRPWHSITGGGMLVATDDGRAPKDLPQDTKVQVPFWLAQGFVRRVTMDLDVPEIYGDSALEDLQQDAIVCRLRDKTPYYFQIGVRTATLVKQPSIERALFAGLSTRWKQIVTLLSKMGVKRSNASRLAPGVSLFPSTLTRLEECMLDGGREAEGQLTQWINRFAVFEMRCSHVAEAPAKRLKVA
eukprot:TRINITY_DN3625_c0_g2_i1.p1 TRINITY_DN3625_c0_g2~~TRINITY_DN3625_c0_g2_i1.p1  ORF type:complete len:205 (-),score=41.50 TRINITY_DN3625_c0_g2_i1:55-669(-)